MVGHQAKTMDMVSEAFNSPPPEEQTEAGAILVIEKNPLAIITMEKNVIQCSGVDNSWFSRKAEAFTDGLTLESIRYIPGTLGPRIKELIENMLTNDPTTRPSANELIDPWEGIFREVVEQCQRLEGRVF
jgi:hypothetical protein